MIWRLEYENAHGDVARLDIQRGAATPIETIEGTENPFLLSYELEDKNKKGFIMSSFADISIYETDTFNIDDLKTLDETALSVKWYINSVLEWTGFVVPDFFSRTIGEPAIVNLAASDRLSSLEDATLDGLSEYVKLKDLAIACLAKTGLSLPLISTVDFKAGTTNVMDVLALSERLEDDKGKKISCFDVLRSILVLTNSTIRQRKGQWRIYNKIQHEALTPTLNFNEVYQGAKRTIQPVFSSVGAFQEFGGMKIYPKNNTFSNSAAGWVAENGFVTEFDNRELNYTSSDLPPTFGEETNKINLINRNVWTPGSFDTAKKLSSPPFKVPFRGADRVAFTLEINASARPNQRFRYALIKRVNGVPVSFMRNDDTWLKDSGSYSGSWSHFPRQKDGEPYSSVDAIFTINANVYLEESEDPEKVTLTVHILGVDSYTPAGVQTLASVIRSMTVKFDEKNDAKGILYRTDQLGNFSKKSDPDTTIFGDHISSGLNGYFYPYSEDDTSVLRAPSGLNPPLYKWTTATDPAAGELPILQHVTRQMSRMFGVAHNILSAVIDAKTFDPLAIVTNCAGEKYVIVAATFDFLRSTVEVELQQIAYGSLLRRDFIFSYFGGGDGDGISSIGSVSGGGSSGGSGGGGGIPQTLDLIADELFISGGNSVDLGVYARKTWVETEATAYDSARLGGQLANLYPRRNVDETISGMWTFSGDIKLPTGSIDIGTRNGDGIRFRNTDAFKIYVSQSSDATLGGNLAGTADINMYFKTTGANRGWAFKYDNNIVAQIQGNGSLSAIGNLAISGTSTLTGNVTAGGNVGTSNFVSQMLGWRVTPQGQADFRHIFTDELQAKAFTADISQALVGSDVLTKSVAKLAQNWATTANGATSTIYVEELEGFPDFQVFAVGDRLLLRLFDRAGGGLLIKNIWATVASYVSTTKNVQRYTITVNSGGATGQTVYAGSMILDYGTPGSGVIERTVLDQQGSPYSRVSTWTGSPDNPANYTLHYQSGNLNGISNAEGWGVYSQNSFLTGKLLVGDLTKAGQFMEYKNGQLTIKGQITVTGGNAATKAYVDAVQVGGRNLLRNTAKFISLTPWGANLTAGSITIAPNVDGEPAVLFAATKNGMYQSVPVTNLQDGGTYTISFWAKSVGASSQVNAGFLNQGGMGRVFNIAGGWTVYKYTFTALMNTSKNTLFHFYSTPTTGAGFYLKNIKLELGNRATDWTPAPEDVPSALGYLAKAIQDGTTDIEGGLVTTNVLMVKDTNGAVRGGMSGLKSDNIGFWTGGSYQGAINNNANVIFRKDGSFSLADGKIIGTSDGALSIDGGVVTGMIESSNYNGTVGSSFDLYNGHLLIGDAIRMSGDTSEIHVRNRDTGLDSFRIGDFTLTQPGSAGAGVDVPLSSSPVTVSPAAGSYQLNRTVYVHGSGQLLTSAAVISNSLIPGGTYNFHTHLKVTLTQDTYIETVPGYIMGEGFYGRSGRIKMQLKNYNKVVWERNIFTIPANGVIPLSVNTSFQAVSPQLQLIITIDGEFEYRQPFDSGTRLYNTTASIERLNSLSKLVLQALVSRMEFSTKGMQAIFSNTHFFRCQSGLIGGRGTFEFISPNGEYGLRVSNTGIRKTTNGGESWVLL